MPIVDGLYVAPQWRNNQDPAINAIELNAISQTLQMLQTKLASIYPTALPSITTGDEGAFIRVVNEAYTLVQLANLDEEEY